MSCVSLASSDSETKSLRIRRQERSRVHGWVRGSSVHPLPGCYHAEMSLRQQRADPRPNQPKGVKEIVLEGLGQKRAKVLEIRQLRHLLVQRGAGFYIFVGNVLFFKKTSDLLL